MNENLTKAIQSFAFFEAEIARAHSAAIKAGNQFAEIAMFELIERAAALRVKLRRVEDAAALS